MPLIWWRDKISVRLSDLSSFPGERHKMRKIEDIFPCLSQMTDFIALMEQQCIDEALM